MKPYIPVVIVASYLIIGVALGFLSESLAKKKGYTGQIFFVLTIVFDIFGLIAVCALPDKKAMQEMTEELKSVNKKLSYLLEEVDEEAGPSSQPVKKPEAVKEARSLSPYGREPENIPARTDYRSSYGNRAYEEEASQRAYPSENPYGQAQKPYDSGARYAPQETYSGEESLTRGKSFYSSAPVGREVSSFDSAKKEVYSSSSAKGREASVVYRDGMVCCSACGGRIKLSATECPHCHSKIVMSSRASGLGYMKPLDLDGE